MKDYKISLIIPAYNEGEYIGQCLDSVMKNCKDKFCEIIVVDNASTDNTKAVAEMRPGVKVFTENRKGVTRARQRGYLESSGDLLAYIDADTKIPEGWFERIVKEFENDANIVCLSGPYIYHANSKTSQFVTRLYWILAMPVYWMVGYMVIGGNFVIKKEVLKKTDGFDTNIEFYGDDTNIGRRAYAYGKVKFMPSHHVHSSPRRFEKQGFFSTMKEYLLNFLSEVFLHKPITSEYKDFR